MDIPILTSQKEMTDDEIDRAFSRLFANIWSKGWKIGFYEDPDKPIACPFVDMEHKAWFNMGVTDGFDAKCKIEEAETV